MLKKAHFNQKF